MPYQIDLYKNYLNFAQKKYKPGPGDDVKEFEGFLSDIKKQPDAYFPFVETFYSKGGEIIYPKCGEPANAPGGSILECRHRTDLFQLLEFQTEQDPTEQINGDLYESCVAALEFEHEEFRRAGNYGIVEKIFNAANKIATGNFEMDDISPLDFYHLVNALTFLHTRLNIFDEAAREYPDFEKNAGRFNWSTVDVTFNLPPIVLTDRFMDAIFAVRDFWKSNAPGRAVTYREHFNTELTTAENKPRFTSYYLKHINDPALVIDLSLFDDLITNGLIKSNVACHFFPEYLIKTPGFDLFKDYKIETRQDTDNPATAAMAAMNALNDAKLELSEYKAAALLATREKSSDVSRLAKKCSECRLSVEELQEASDAAFDRLSIPDSSPLNLYSPPGHPFGLGYPTLGRMNKEGVRVKTGDKILTNYNMVPQRFINADGDVSVDVKFFTVGKAVTKRISSQAWTSTSNYLKEAPSDHHFCTTVGNTGDIQKMKPHLVSYKDVPEITGVSCIGIYGKDHVNIFGNHCGCFVDDVGCINSRGASSEYISTAKDNTGCKMSQQCPDIAVFAAADLRNRGKDTLKAVTNFNDPSVSLPLVTWCVPLLFKRTIMEIFHHFPICTIEAGPGAGKTTLIREFVCRFFSMRSSILSAGSQTEYTYLTAAASRNNLPLIIDEFKMGIGSRFKSEETSGMISALIRNGYDGLKGTRGRYNRPNDVFPTTAGLLISGESGLSEAAILDRTVCIRPSKLKSAMYKEKVDFPVEDLGALVLRNSLIWSDDQVKLMIDRELKKVDPELTGRPRFNAAVLRFGLIVLGHILKSDPTPEMFTILDDVVKKTVSDSNDIVERLGPADRYIEAFGLMSTKGTSKNHDGFMYSPSLEANVHYSLKEGGLIALHLPHISQLFGQWANTYNFEGERLAKKVFKSQIKAEPYFKEEKVTKFGSKPHGAIILDINKMIEKGLDLPAEWTYGIRG